MEFPKKPWKKGGQQGRAPNWEGASEGAGWEAEMLSVDSRGPPEAPET